jgi:2-polyprenyl-3-methyl-5-hydroxy-6-metoxy-1,4-benzoquinol methylase
MNPSAGVNSIEWWNEYFRGQWLDYGGPGQTRHFMQRMVGALPAVDVAFLEQHPLSIIDWGCACGDGSDELAARFPNARVAGIDVADEALKHARKTYGHLEFLAASATDAVGALPRAFDVVFNSNSLEHFERPLEVLSSNLAATRLLHLTLVPYRESPLSIHHRVSLDEDSFPLQLQGFERIFCQVIEVDPAYWPSGRQLLVGYASREYLVRRAQVEQASAERAKWDAVYRDLPLVPIDPIASRFNEELAEAVRDLLPSGGTVLEAGCGGGNQSIGLATAGFDVSLMDFSSAALDYARRNFDHRKLTAHFIRADAFETGSPEYDLVFNAGVLEHYDLDDQARLLKAMASRSRGFVLALVPNRSCYWYWVWRLGKTVGADWPFGKEVPQSTLADAFALAGLEYLGERHLGSAWTEYFIENVDGIDASLRASLVRLHRSGIVPPQTCGYLVAAAGRVAGGPKPAAAWQQAAGSSGEVRRNEEITAMLADALAQQIAGEQRLATQDRQRRDELRQMQARLDESAAELEIVRAGLKEAEAKLPGLRSEREELAALADRKEAELQAIYGSRAWRLISALRTLTGRSSRG